MKYWCPHARVPNDLDILSKKKETRPLYFVEYHWADVMQYVMDSNKHELMVDLDYLYTIKLSHVPWVGLNGKWVQHLKDINVMRKYRAKVDKVLYSRLYQHWVERFKGKSVSLMKNTEEFFTSSIKRKYPHDELHKMLSYYEEPMHTKIKKDGHSISCSESKFTHLSEEDKVLTFLEELYVIVAERFIYVEKPEPMRLAINKAIHLLITSLTTGWFNIFICQHAAALKSGDYQQQQYYFERKINENL